MNQENIISTFKFNILKDADSTITRCILKLLFIVTIITITLILTYQLLFSLPTYIYEFPLCSIPSFLFYLGLIISIVILILNVRMFCANFIEVFYEYKSKTILQNYINSFIAIDIKYIHDTNVITNELIQTLFKVFLKDKNKNSILLMLEIETFITTYKLLNKTQMDTYSDKDVNINSDDLNTLNLWIKLMKLNCKNLTEFNKQFQLIIEDKKLIIIENINNVKRYYQPQLPFSI